MQCRVSGRRLCASCCQGLGDLLLGRSFSARTASYVSHAQRGASVLRTKAWHCLLGALRRPAWSPTEKENPKAVSEAVKVGPGRPGSQREGGALKAGERNGIHPSESVWPWTRLETSGRGLSQSTWGQFQSFFRIKAGPSAAEPGRVAAAARKHGPSFVWVF